MSASPGKALKVELILDAKTSLGEHLTPIFVKVFSNVQ